MKTFTENILDGVIIGETFFDNLLAAAKSRREAMRPWQQLVTEDGSNTAGAGTTFETNFSLPTTFRIPYGNLRRAPMVLVETSNADNYLEYQQSAFQQRRINKNKARMFVIDMVNSRFHLLGPALGATYTIYLYFIADSAAIADSADWVFPSRFHPLLCFDVAAMFRGGVDYDDINARLSEDNRAEARALWTAMVFWDDDLARKNTGF